MRTGITLATLVVTLSCTNPTIIEQPLVGKPPKKPLETVRHEQPQLTLDPKFMSELDGLYKKTLLKKEEDSDYATILKTLPPYLELTLWDQLQGATPSAFTAPVAFANRVLNFGSSQLRINDQAYSLHPVNGTLSAFLIPNDPYLFQQLPPGTYEATVTTSYGTGDDKQTLEASCTFAVKSLE